MGVPPFLPKKWGPGWASQVPCRSNGVRKNPQRSRLRPLFRPFQRRNPTIPHRWKRYPRKEAAMKSTPFSCCFWLSFLTGCRLLLERSYTAVTPTPSFPTSQKRRHPPGGDLPGPGQRPAVPGGGGGGGPCVSTSTAASGTAASDVDQACLEVPGGPLGSLRGGLYQVRCEADALLLPGGGQTGLRSGPRGAQPGDLVTGSTAVEQELRALLPDQPEKVVFRISYFTQEDSAETLRQAVQEAYQAQTRPCPPSGGGGEALPGQRPATGGGKILLTGTRPWKIFWEI